MSLLYSLLGDQSGDTPFSPRARERAFPQASRMGWRSESDPLSLTTPSSLIGQSTPVDGSVHGLSSLIDQITASVGEVKQISIDDCVTMLSGLLSACKALKSDQAPAEGKAGDNADLFDIYLFKEDHEFAISLVLLYTSTYPAKATTVALDVNLLNKFPSSAAKELPSLLKPVETRKDSSDVQERFLKLQAARLNTTDFSGFFERTTTMSKTYMVKREETINKIEELIELFTSFKEIERISLMFQRIKEMKLQAVKTAKEKKESYDKLKDIKDSIKAWETQSQQIYKGISDINEQTVCDAQTKANIASIDSAFTESITCVINQLPIERISNELKLSTSMLSVCASLSHPFIDMVDNQKTSLSIDCPVCLTVVDDNVYAVTVCGHLMCGECIERLDTCPVCRVNFNSSQKLKIFTKL